MNQKAACDTWNAICGEHEHTGGLSGLGVFALTREVPIFLFDRERAKIHCEEYDDRPGGEADYQRARAAAAHFLRMFADAIEGEDGQPSPLHEEEEEK